MLTRLDMLFDRSVWTRVSTSPFPNRKVLTIPLPQNNLALLVQNFAIRRARFVKVNDKLLALDRVRDLLEIAESPGQIYQVFNSHANINNYIRNDNIHLRWHSSNVKLVLITAESSPRRRTIPEQRRCKLQ